MSLPSTTLFPGASARWLVLRMVCGVLLAPSLGAVAADATEVDSKPATTTPSSATNAPNAKTLEVSTSNKDAATEAPAVGIVQTGSGTNATPAATTNEVAKKAEAVSDTDESNSGRREDRGRDRRRRDKSSSSSDAPSAPANKGKDFASFKIITDRNIFSPSRTTPSAARSEAPPVPKVDSFSLVGTLSYDKGDFAFFDGSGSEYRKALKAADSIAGYKILSIAENEVVLESGDKKLTLKMGGQFRRVDDGPWEQKSAASETSDSAAKSSGSANADSSGSAGGAEDEILQRLLKKREQELNNEKR